MANTLVTSYMAVDIRKHLLSFPLESPTDFMCIKGEKITYSAGGPKRRRSDVTWFEIYGPVTPADSQKAIVDGMQHGF